MVEGYILAFSPRVLKDPITSDCAIGCLEMARQTAFQSDYNAQVCPPVIYLLVNQKDIAQILFHYTCDQLMNCNFFTATDLGI